MEEAVASWPMRRLLSQYGMSQFAERSKAELKKEPCPYCGRKGKFEVFKGSSGRDMVRCWISSCRANRPMDEIGFIQLAENMGEGREGRNLAFKKLLELAGVTIERAKNRHPSPNPQEQSPVAQPEQPEARSERPESDPEPAPRPEPGWERRRHPESEKPRGKRDYYEILGIPKTATNAEVKKSYRRLAVKYHPDKNPGDPHAEERFKELGEAYDVLIDEQKRAAYDRYGHEAFAPKGVKTPPPKPKPKPSDVWAAFHSRISLTETDRARLKEKRGFTDETIDRLGYRSSGISNARVIEELSKEFPDYLLLETGLCKLKGNRMIPERQFTGWGNTGKKDDKGELIWDICNPILIPYLDHDGRVISMRPHKGNIAKQDKDDDESCGGDVYCPFILESRLDGIAEDSPLFNATVLTESEFKGGALWQTGFPCMGIPGISMPRNPVFRSRLVEMIERFNIRKLIIVFDNEVKDNPNLPSYKPDPFQRHWTVIWARYIAWDLMNCAPRPACLDEVLIGKLPDEWRLDDEGRDTGKIDWDTALANFVKREGPIHGTARATREFERVLLDAQTPKDFISLLPDEEKTIVEKQLQNLFHKPALASGGSREEKLARRLDKIGKRSPVSFQGWAQKMINLLRSIKGCYFIYHPISDKQRFVVTHLRDDLSREIGDLQMYRGEKPKPGEESVEEAIARKKVERRLLNEMLDPDRGWPEAVSNFTLDCRHCLHKVTGDTERMVNIKNNQGEETGILQIPGGDLGGLKEFRKWCLSKAKGVPVWHGGEKDLQALTRDMKHYSAWQNVYEVPHFGHAAGSRIWFAGDCAWPPSGTFLRPNDENIVWYNSVGYTVTTNPTVTDQPDEGFQQGAPTFMRTRKTEPDVKELFTALSNNLFNTIGDYDALLAIGIMLLYAAAPEIYREHGGHPGLWLCGKKGSGKTTIARWLMKIWGFKDLQGTRIDKGCTPVAMARMLTQYSNLPVWFDEFRRTIPDIQQKESVLRGAFDRSSAAKGRMDSTNKTNTVRALTTPLVTGETPSDDSATKSRYVHIQIAPSRRRLSKEENSKTYHTLQNKSEQFYAIGKYLMDNREAFAKSNLEQLEIWMRTQTQIEDDRTRFVHGAGWAAYLALAEMIGSAPCNIQDFTKYTIHHAQQAAQDTHEDTMCNKFFNDVIAAVSTGDIPRDFFQERDIVLDKTNGWAGEASINPPDTPTTKVVFIAHGEVYRIYEKDMRQRGNVPDLSRSDIQREISREPYWVQSTATCRVHRIRVGGRQFSCWGIIVDKFPLGQSLMDALQTQFGQ